MLRIAVVQFGIVVVNVFSITVGVVVVVHDVVTYPIVAVFSVVVVGDVVGCDITMMVKVVVVTTAGIGVDYGVCDVVYCDVVVV